MYPTHPGFLAPLAAGLRRTAAVWLLTTLAGTGLAAAGSDQDAQFLTKAATGSIAEVSLARLAQSKTDDEQVRQFAQMMIEDHDKALEQARDVAASNDLTLEGKLSEQQKQQADRLSQQSGAQFNEAYMQAMVENHQKTVQEFERQAQQGSGAVAAYAQQQLPVLRQHLERAQTIAASL